MTYDSDTIAVAPEGLPTSKSDFHSSHSAPLGCPRLSAACEHTEAVVSPAVLEERSSLESGGSGASGAGLEPVVASRECGIRDWMGIYRKVRCIRVGR
eukprot:scaffold31160_cov73-Cyclotella_meneghiniana.AAC.11